MTTSRLFTRPELKLHFNNKSKRWFITISTEMGHTSAVPVDKDTATAIRALHKSSVYGEEFTVYSII